MTIASYGANHVKVQELSENKISLNFSDDLFEEPAKVVSLTKTCNYHFYDEDGNYLCSVTFDDVPANVSCGSNVLVHMAIRDFERNY